MTDLDIKPVLPFQLTQPRLAPLKIVFPRSLGSSKVTALRVQDIARQLWFNWDMGSWDANGVPKVTVGTNTIYIAAYAQNTTSTYQVIRIELVNSGNVLAWRSLQIAAGAGIGVEWTGNMPQSGLIVNINSTP